MKPPEKVYLIDTNVILRFLFDDHPEFSPKATAFMLNVAQGISKAELLDVVIVECVYVMEKFYRIPRKEITDKLSKILNFSGIINSDRSELLQTLLKFETSNADIVDCLLAAISSSSRVVVSFDKDMQKLKAFSETL
uniref:PIN domain-containing protein n=1 Tax=Candidatus Desulfatibia profunda TaxID=2841695 RepID=A0A8J6TMU5_9BACT|nr:PIN domain-containing protein [Candidatus Desulfatibia profunda]